MKFLVIALTLALASASPVKEISSHDAVSLVVNGVADDQVVDLTSIVGIELNDVKDGAVDNIDIMAQFYEVQAEAAAGQIVAAPAIAPVEEMHILPISIDGSVVQPIAPAEEMQILPITIDESAVVALPIVAPVEGINILPISIDGSVVQPIAPAEEMHILPINIDESAVVAQPIVAPVEEINILPISIDESAVQAVEPINGEVFNDGQVSFSVYGATQDALNKLSSWMSVMYNYVAGGVSASSDLI